MGGVYQSGIHMNTRTQGLPAKHWIVIRGSMFFTLAVCDFKVVADWCTLLTSTKNYNARKEKKLLENKGLIMCLRETDFCNY